MQTTAAQLGFSDSTVPAPKSQADDLKMIRLARAHYSTLSQLYIKDVNHINSACPDVCLLSHAGHSQWPKAARSQLPVSTRFNPPSPKLQVYSLNLFSSPSPNAIPSHKAAPDCSLPWLPTIQGYLDFT